MAKPQISLCMIVAPTDDEAKLLDRCLESVAPFVDEICLTITGENKACEEVAEKYKAKVSHFEWVDHYAKARNFNFSQATGDWILWLDCDDVLKGGEFLSAIVGESKLLNAIICDYLYEFDADGDCIVRHQKTRLIKNDGSQEWAGKLHEDFKVNRQVEVGRTEQITVEHYPAKSDIEDTIARNIRISTEGIKEEPQDPRSWWNYACSLMMAGKTKESIDNFYKFIEMSNSEEERYIAWDRIGYMYKTLGHFDEAVHCELMALSLRPWYPDAWVALGEIYYRTNKLDHAKFYLLEGLKLKPPVTEIIAWNPRIYDFVPLRLLAKVYYENKQPKEALQCIQTVRKLFPKNKELIRVEAELTKEVGDIADLESRLEKVKTATSKEQIKEILDSVPVDLQNHPMVTHLRNIHFIKTHTSGKEVAIYCAHTNMNWGPDSVKTGIGGSEEAVINLSKRWADEGFDVTVYASCGHKEFVQDGVTWKPFWTFNHRDKFDTLILWRTPIFCDIELNAKRILIDMHDVISEAEFTPERLKKIDKIMVKSKAHRELFPHIPDEKFEVVPNGIDPKHFDCVVKREPFRLLNTSSPDRGLSTAIDIFRLVKQQVPEAEFHWFYGWNVFDAAYSDNESQMEWKNNLVKKMEETNGFFIHERVGHEEIAQEYQKAKVFFYPTEFYEIHCISAAKAQAGGAIPIVTDVAALKETVQFGWKLPYQDIYSNKVGQKVIADTVVNLLRNNTNEPGADKEMMQWAKDKYNWENVAKLWSKLFS